MTIFLHRVITLLLIAAGFGIFSLQTSTLTHAQTADEALEEHQQMQQSLRDSQTRVDNLDDQRLEMLAEYRSELRRLEDLNSYNENLQELLNSQAAEQQRINEDLAELEAIRRDLVPLMLEMQRAMENFVRLDLPFLPEERASRVQALDNLLKRSDVDIAEKYRRLIEAYIIEAEYGQTLEAYEGTLTTGNQQRTVDFLRLGRTALFYITLDRTEVGIWDSQTNNWHALPNSFVDPVMQAVRMARQQVPPDLLRLPLPQPQPASIATEGAP